MEKFKSRITEHDQSILSSPLTIEKTKTSYSRKASRLKAIECALESEIRNEECLKRFGILTPTKRS